MSHSTLVSLFSDIANSIRNKTGESSLIIADNFPDAINSIKTTLPSQEKIAVPSTLDVVTTPDEGYVLSKVTTKAVSLVGTASNILTSTSVSVQSNGGTITSLAGTMPNNGSISKDDLAPGSTYTIPAGYTTGGSVKAKSNTGSMTPSPNVFYIPSTGPSTNTESLSQNAMFANTHGELQDGLIFHNGTQYKLYYMW